MKESIEIKSLKGVEFEGIFQAFQNAFADYDAPMPGFEQLKQMVTRRGYLSELSFGAFDNGELVSFTLNGVGNWNNKKTAYDTGTGTVKNYRGLGLAKRIFLESVPELKAAGVEQYLLEVMQYNEKAVKLYKGIGFEVTREFEYFVSDRKEINFDTALKNDVIEIKETNIPDFDTIKHFWDFEPSWQNSLDSVNRTPELFKAIAAFKNKEMVGYIICQLNTGDITQIAVDKAQRNNGIATNLLKKIETGIGRKEIQVINTDILYKPIKSFLEKRGIKSRGKQYEMILIL